jgi:hypothetical protein
MVGSGRLVAGALAAGLVLSAVSGAVASGQAGATTVPPAAGSPAGGSPAGTPRAAATEATALAAARRSGRPVEVSSLRTETGQVFANPSGTLTTEEYAQPVRVRQGNHWAAVDPTLKVQRDGTLRPVATPLPMTFSGGGAGTLARVSWQGRHFGLGWPAKLPRPVLAGATATYPEVFPGVDLVLTAGILGFSEVLVVRSAAAAANPALASLRFPTRLDGGLTTRVDAAGNVDAVDAAGTPTFHLGTPIGWDSALAAPTAGPATAGHATPSAKEGGTALSGPPTGARVTAMAVTTEKGALVVRPDRKWLTDKARTFPLYLDPNPTFAGARTAWTSVWALHTTTSYFNQNDIARVGHEDAEHNTNRSFFQLNTAGVRGKHIVRATFQTVETWSWGCLTVGHEQRVELWRTSGINASTTWNAQPAKQGARLAIVNAAYGHDAGCPQHGIDFDATAGVVTAAAANSTTLTLGLYATSETDTFGWKKFASNPKLIIEYNSTPSAPTSLVIAPSVRCVSGANRPAIGDDSPTLKAVLGDPDAAASGQQVRGRFQWYVKGGAKIGEQLTAFKNSGNVHQADPPVSAFHDNGTYSWRVRAEDGTDVGPWSAWCEWILDRTRPHPPNVASTTYPRNLIGEAVVFGGGINVPGAFTLTPASADTDVLSYRWGLDVDTPTTVANPAAGTKTATITVTPTKDQRHTLTVVSIDRAGNPSDEQNYDFYVRPVTTPVGWWQLDESAGTTAADSMPNGHPATATGGLTWAAGRVGGAGHFNGTDASLSTTGPPLRTDVSFSVSAWVRLTDTFHNITALGQDGVRNSPFLLRYDGEKDRWGMEMTSADNDSETLDRALSAAPPRYFVWTHLTGVYDAPNHQIRLYVDGVPQTPVSHATSWNSTGALTIGRGKWHGFLIDQWAGDLDDVQVFQGVLPDPFIASLANRPPSLLGQWTADETGGTTLADSSGAGRTATVSGGGTFEPGWLDGSLTLDGSTGSAAVGQPVVRTDQPFTVSAWVRFTGATATTNYTAVSQDGVTNSGFKLGYDYFARAWRFSMPTVDASGEAEPSAVDFEEAALDSWTHLVGEYDPSGGDFKRGVLRLYVNGVAERFTSLDQTTAFQPWMATGTLAIGRAKWHNFLVDYWAGGVDDVRVYQGLLSECEIAELAGSDVACAAADPDPTGFPTDDPSTSPNDLTARIPSGDPPTIPAQSTVDGTVADRRSR